MTLAFAAALSALGCGGAPQIYRAEAGLQLSAQQQQRLSTAIEHVLERHGVDGAGVALVSGKHVLYQAGFGSTQEGAERISPRTRFHLSDVTRLLTTTLALRLEDAGKLRISEPLDALAPMPFPALPGYAHATVQEVLTEHSGFAPGPYHGFGSSEPPPNYETSWTQLGDLVRERYAFKPGLTYAPSTMGWRVLGAGLTQRTGLSFGELLRREVLQPVGMKDTGLFGVDVQTQEAEPRYWRDVPALGGMSSIHDMARWLAVVLGDGLGPGGERVLSERALAQLWRTQNKSVALDNGYPVGLGLVGVGLNPAGESNVLGSRSYLPPDTSLVWVEPAAADASRIGVVAWCPTRNGYDALRDVALACTQILKDQPVTEENPLPEQDVEITSAQALALAGWYLSPAGPIEITASGSALSLNAVGYSFVLIPQQDRSFRPKLRLFGLMNISLDAARPFRIRFNQVEGKRYLYVYRSGVLYATAEEVGTWPVSEKWRERQGHYELLNGEEKSLFEDIELVYDEERQWLVLRLGLSTGKFDLNYVLQPLSETEAVLAGRGQLMGSRVLLDDWQDQRLLYLSGFQARRTRLRKEP